MYRKMLVPLDGSERAEVVLPYVKELGVGLGAEVFLLHIYSNDHADLMPMYRGYLERVAEVLRCDLSQIPGKGQGLDIHIELTEGRPEERILSYAEAHEIDLIVMSTHGAGGMRGSPLGSVADRVLRLAPAPVWLVPCEMPEGLLAREWPPRSILVPLDGSELAESVIPYVQALAGQIDSGPAEVILLRICEPPFVPADYPTSIPVPWEEHVQQEMQQQKLVCERYLTDPEKRLREAGVNVRAEVALGKAAEQIVDFAARNPASLIVIGTHGRSGLGRWAYGSVTERVLQGICSPVLLIKPS